jgi:hypothetical protein
MTPRSSRAQPARSFSEYTVSRDSADDLGITSLPWARMTRAIAGGATTGDVVVPLGQRFNFDGRTFDRAMVAPNGYLALGVTSSLQLMGTPGDNTTLSASLAPSGSVVLAPWFAKLATAIASDGPHGGVWYAYDHGPDGVRTVVRWHCRCAPNATTDDLSLLTFECVLCANGEVQFRYAPLVQGARPVSESGAAIAVFMTGTNVFRDLTRDNTVLGGASYAVGFLDGSSPFVRSLTSSRGWPGGGLLGSIWRLTPRRLLRAGVPRADSLAAEALEHAPSTMAAPGRLSRRRPYDDRSTLACTSGVVNLPTSLPHWARAAWPGGTRLSDVFTGLDVTASVSPSATSGWHTARAEARSEPFVEAWQPEQDTPGSTFFATGTALHETAGLSSPLRSKAVVRIELPIAFSTAMSAQTASLYCYDDAAGKMVLVGSTTRERPSDSIVLAGDAQLFGPSGHALISGSYGTSGSIALAPFQVAHPWVGCAPTKQTIEAALQFLQTGSVTLSQAHGPVQGGFVPITMSRYIDRPFLVEKAVIDVPLAAGPGWFIDRTRTVLDNIPVGSPVGFELSADMGGPCLTVALLSCMRDRREIILSGTIVPEGDATSRSTFTYYTTGGLGLGPTAVYEHTVEGFVPYGGVPTAVVPSGSNSFFTGTVRLAAEARTCNGYLALANGRNYYPYVSSSAAYLANEVGKDVVDLASATPGAYFLHSLAPFGRARTGFEASGRSLMGREHVGPAYRRGTVFGVPSPFACVRAEALAQLEGSSFFTGSYVVLPNAGMFVGGSAVSPYVLQPNDRLAVAIAKHRPARSAAARTVTSGTVGMKTSPLAGVLTGSHDVTLVTGTLKVTLYGSYLAHGTEHQGTMRQVLGTACASEVIGDEPVLDQFELEHRSALSGALFDDFMTGTLVSVDERVGVRRLVTGRRGRAFSTTDARAAGSGVLSAGSVTLALVPAWELAGSVRNSQHIATERLYDTLLPPHDAIARCDGSQLVSYVGSGSDDPFLTGAWSFMDAYGAGVTGDVPASATNTNWSWAFPFEPRYASLVRQAGLQRHVVTRGDYDGANVSATDGRPTANVIVAAGTLAPGAIAVSYVVACDFVSGVATGSIVPAPPGDLVKVLYGFGDDNTYALGGGTSLGYTHFPSFRARTFADVNRSRIAYSASPVIRGWKYGLACGLPLSPHAVFRRGRFGQFRDMLEQRIDTKFLVTGRVEQGPVTVRFFKYPSSGSGPVPARPWETSSSNMSPEATSSLPYFDGAARN